MEWKGGKSVKAGEPCAKSSPVEADERERAGAHTFTGGSTASSFTTSRKMIGADKMTRQ